MKTKLYIKEFVKDKNVGAITSTSDHVVKKIIEKIDFIKAEKIVEYGPGNGVITRLLLQVLGRYYGIFGQVLLMIFLNLELLMDNIMPDLLMMEWIRIFGLLNQIGVTGLMHIGFQDQERQIQHSHLLLLQALMIFFLSIMLQKQIKLLH